MYLVALGINISSSRQIPVCYLFVSPQKGALNGPERSEENLRVAKTDLGFYLLGPEFSRRRHEPFVMPKPPPPNGKRRREDALEDRRGPSTKRLKTDTITITSWTTTPRYPWLALIQSASEVGIEHVLALCGLGPLAKTPLCPNKFQQQQRQQLQQRVECAVGDSRVVVEASSSSGDGDRDGDSEDNEITITTHSNCSKVSCKNNPYCLNYLGQERWENQGQSQSDLENVSTLL
jgi:hypothetical protein